MPSSYEDHVYTALGFCGGLLLASAQLPQIYRVQSRRSSEDISYAYQFTFATGMVMFLVYYSYFGLLPLLLPATLSFSCITYLIILKVYLEVILPRRRAARDKKVLTADDSDRISNGGGGGGGGGDSLREALLSEGANGDEDHSIEGGGRVAHQDIAQDKDSCTVTI